MLVAPALACRYKFIIYALKCACTICWAARQFMYCSRLRHHTVGKFGSVNASRNRMDQDFSKYVWQMNRSTRRLLTRVHNISIKGECLTAYIPCTNALHQVTPVNYCILSDLIYA